MHSTLWFKVLQIKLVLEFPARGADLNGTRTHREASITPTRWLWTQANLNESASNYF